MEQKKITILNGSLIKKEAVLFSNRHKVGIFIILTTKLAREKVTVPWVVKDKRMIHSQIEAVLPCFLTFFLPKDLLNKYQRSYHRLVKMESLSCKFQTDHTRLNPDAIYKKKVQLFWGKNVL